ncbi:MAG: N-acetylglucosamine-6-sulfatase [Mycobacteriales bacterium]
MESTRRSALWRRPRWRVVSLVATAAAGAALLAGGGAPAGGVAATGAPVPAGRPNVVFVLTDDLSWNLLQYMPHVRELRRAGSTFTDYTVTDSLCCPSRSSILTGRFPHNTGVFTNSAPDGGFGVFHGRGEEAQTFATGLQAAGYRTAMMGKYLNGYQPAATQGGATPYVPPGWNEWDVAGNGYPEFDYTLNENHALVHYGHRPQDYLTDVIAGKGAAFIADSAAAGTPFLLELATFAPHAPYTPAPRDAADFPGLRAPRGPAFDRLPTDAPSWLAGRAPLTPRETAAIDTGFRQRVRAVQAVDDMVGTLRATLRTAGVADDTYLVFSSDNGYHMGEYRLNPGKMTAFDTDIRVPLVVTGPGVPAGRTRTEPVENVDLAPTFLALGAAAVPAAVDGRSLVPLLHGAQAPGWRDAALVEHHGPDLDNADPDRPAPHSGNPTSYKAIRTTTGTYVEYSTGEREYYDRARDPNELHNVAAQLPASKLAQLHATLDALRHCSGTAACWSAAHVTN